MPLPLNLDLTIVVKKLAIDCGVDSYTVSYILKRLHNEGIKVLTVSLPLLSKAVLAGLEHKFFDRSKLTLFSWKAALLRPFAGLLGKIFSVNTGRLLDDPCELAVWSIRQFCEYFYKLALDFEGHTLVTAEANYLQTEAELSAFVVDPSWADTLRKNFETHYAEISRAEPHQVFSSSRPRDGSGSFVGFVPTPNAEHFAKWKCLPDSEIGTCYSGFRGFSGYFKSYPSAPTAISLVGTGKICEVLFVPKDSRGPRVISKEPFHLLRAQLAYFDWLSAALERVTHCRVRFYDQSRSRALAKESSVTGENATLDLKDASDRVSLRLVEHVFLNSPACRWFVGNTRSTHARLPSGKVLLLSKLAGMGSGLTFATMALIIHLSIASLVSRRFGIPYKDCMGRIHVYGDDVIVPRQWFDVAVEGLALSGLLVNRSKSFRHGSFRESCGGDFFRGQDVAPVRLKLAGAGLKQPGFYKRGCIRVSSDSGVLQFERHTREVYLAGLTHLTAYYKSKLRASLKYFPKVSGSSPVLGDYHYSGVYVPDGPQRSYVVTPVVSEMDSMDPYRHLGRFLSRPSGVANQHDLYYADPSPIKRFGDVVLPRRVRLKLRTMGDISLRS